MEGETIRTNWRYVGSGHGTYEPEQDFNFVGDGSGSFRKVIRTEKEGWVAGRYCTILLFVVPLAMLVWILISTLVQLWKRSPP